MFLKCVISGSFRKHYDQICAAITNFEKAGVAVLSPQKSKITNPGESFALLESDDTIDRKSLESKHLDAIRECDFLYVCNPGGYIGGSTLLEIGFAIACNKKVYYSEEPTEEIVRLFASVYNQSHDLPNSHREL